MTKIQLSEKTAVLDSLLSSYQERIEKKIKESLPELGGKGLLKEACEYALLNGGKRFRPALVFMVADALNKGTDVTPSALAIEYFHTASLIADDLPCMDDDVERRNKPSVHKVYGEAVALLASYALISSGYQGIALNTSLKCLSAHPFVEERHRLGMVALENATLNTGLAGATGGQFLDIDPPDLNLETLKEIIHKKTVSLFEISFVFGWIFGGGDLSQLSKVKEIAAAFGMAFQIADDLMDQEQDRLRGKKVNLALVLGEEEAIRMFHGETEKYRKLLKELRLESRELLGIPLWLESLIQNFT